MKPGYPSGPAPHQYLRETIMFANGLHAAAKIKSEPMETSASGSEGEHPVDMSLAQREAYKSREAAYRHASSSGGGSDPSIVSASLPTSVSLPISMGHHSHPQLSPHHKQDRYKDSPRDQQFYQQSQPMSHLSPHPGYNQYIYDLPPHTQHRDGHNALRRKQSTSLSIPVNASPPSPQYPLQLATEPENGMLTSHHHGGDSVLSLPVGLSKNERLSAAPVDDADIERFQPRGNSGHQRARREFVPEEKKDTTYWCKRLKNNDSARRSRVKRKALEKLMESRLLELQKENIELRHEMAAMERRFNLKKSSESGSGGEGDSDGQTMNETSHLSNSSSSLCSNNSRDSSRDNSASPPSEHDKMHREDEEEDLERASAGSDDSRSNDDSRRFSLSSVSALHRSLSPNRKGRVDSISRSNSSTSHISSASSSLREMSSIPVSNTGPVMQIPSSGSSLHSSDDPRMRLDETGALDLSSNDSRSTSARDSPDDIKYRPISDGGGILNEAAAAVMRSMKNFPLKCRWKRELQTSQGSPMNDHRESQ